MQPLTPPEQDSWTEKKYSVEEGFDICIAFFCELWPSFKLRIANEPLDLDGCSTYEFFVETICGWGLDACGEWNDAITRLLNIPIKDQVDLRLSEKDLFLATYEFCKIHNDRFLGELKIIVNLLESMMDSPEKYFFEWGIWVNTIALILSYEEHSFNWNTHLNEWDPL